MINKKNIFADEWLGSSHGEKFQRGHIALTDMSPQMGLGCGAFRVQPGKRAFPKHAHLANDEAIYVIAGSGMLTLGAEECRLREGDFVSLPRGADSPHVFVNDSDEDLIYLCISTMNAPDVVHYPDSGKLGVLESRESWGSESSVSGFYRTQKAGYYDGED